MGRRPIRPMPGEAAMPPSHWEAQPDAGTLPRAPFAADRTLELPMRFLGRTVKRTRDALSALQPGQVLAVVTDDP